jgi:hypothetical protein
MSIYTVHQPPLSAADPLTAAERFAFVRDGFSFWAFVAAAPWMLWHRMWLVLLIYVAAAVGIDKAMYYAGVPVAIIIVVGLLGSVLIGIEASTLRRFALDSGGWEKIGIVSGHDREDAEQRFFHAWLRTALAKPTKPPEPSASASYPAPSAARMPQSPDVIGLFPKPGTGP